MCFDKGIVCYFRIFMNLSFQLHIFFIPFEMKFWNNFFPPFLLMFHCWFSFLFQCILRQFYTDTAIWAKEIFASVSFFIHILSAFSNLFPLFILIMYEANFIIRWTYSDRFSLLLYLFFSLILYCYLPFGPYIVCVCCFYSYFTLFCSMLA